MNDRATDYVVDAAAVAEALIGKSAVGLALRPRLIQSTCHAPHLLDAEVGHVMRRAVRRGDIKDITAATALRALSNLIDHRYVHTGRMAELAWELRHTVSYYDALYVALATMLGQPLLTSDVKLTKASGLTCQVELIQ